MIVLEDRILLHLRDGRRIPVDPQVIYLLEAKGGETLIGAKYIIAQHGYALASSDHKMWGLSP